MKNIDHLYCKRSVCCFVFFLLCNISIVKASIWLECPTNIVLNCDADLSDLDKYGKAWVWENYQKVYAPPPTKVINNTNTCGIGSITRTWEYTDKHSKWHSCSQVITITGANTFSYADITWPQSLELEGCNPNPDPRFLNKPYNYPSFTNKKCAQPMYSYKDMKFTVADGCVKILRDWKVIDWCTYKPNESPQTGVWTYTQIIKLVAIDSAAILTCPKDTIVDSKNDCKGIFVKIDSARGFSKCGKFTNIINNSPYSNQKGADASGYYPMGTTEFYFTAEYSCGQILKCKYKVTVRNKIPPTPYCLVGLNIALMPLDTNKDGTFDAGMIEVWAKDFDRGSYHVCGSKNLKFSFSKDVNDKSRIFTCDQLGKNDIEMWVTDSFGNQSFCKTMLDVQNNNARIPDCKRKDSLTNGKVFSFIKGTVATANGSLTSNVRISLEPAISYTIKQKNIETYTYRYDTIISPSGLTMYIKRTDTIRSITYDTVFTKKMEQQETNSKGVFAFNNLVKDVNYRISAEKESGDLVGITVNDAVVLLRHILGSEKIKDPYKMIAADINCDGIISNLDFDLLYALIMGNKSVDDLKYRWRIIPKSLILDSAAMTKMELIANYYMINKLNAGIESADFIAIKIGELDNQTLQSSILSDRQSKSDLVNIALRKNVISNAYAYPNPFGGSNLFFRVNAMMDQVIEIQIEDINGLVVNKTLALINKGENTIHVNREFIPGIWIYRIKCGDQILNGKIISQ